jgi:hypothetical protein
MDRESLTRIGMRTFPIVLAKNGQHAEITVVTENSGIFFGGEHSPLISTGPESVGSILGKELSI